MSEIVQIDGSSLTPEDVIALAKGQKKAVFCSNARERVSAARAAVEGIISRGETAYGINTGFGSLSKVGIDAADLEQLQVNLVRSHACGMGDLMHPEDVLAMMVIRANSLAKGNSGNRPEVIDLLINCVHSGIAPRVPRIGSLGASGDLAPLAHIAVGLIGEGDAFIRSATQQRWGEFDGWRQTQMSGALKLAGLEPLRLQAKEGLSLINGTTQMCAWFSSAILQLEGLSACADIVLGTSIEALQGSHKPFDDRLHAARPQPGQRRMASRMRHILEDSAINAAHVNCSKVQDAYSLRCSPQVHGPVLDLIDHARQMLEIELNSATDNPLIFPDAANPGPHEVISGGNFHGEILCLHADALSVACHELASISERRTNQLLDPAWSGLPAYLAKDAGLDSGLMIVQYVAAAVIAEMHVLGAPASLSNVPVSNNKEDHVSMGATAAHKLSQQTSLLAKVLACELISAVEALEHQTLKSSAIVEATRAWTRQFVAPLTEDRTWSDDLEKIAQGLLAGDLLAYIRATVPNSTL